MYVHVLYDAIERSSTRTRVIRSFRRANSVFLIARGSRFQFFDGTNRWKIRVLTSHRVRFTAPFTRAKKMGDAKFRKVAIPKRKK